MFTDMVGFTASAQVDEASALARLKEQEGLVRPLLAGYGGREVKSTGDGFLIEFESALKATECAVEIQRRIHQRNSTTPGDPIELRIGMHVGDVEERGGDIWGDAVNVASRIMTVADPGGTCLTGQVFDHVRNKLPYRFEKEASQQLKGLREPIDIYTLVLPWKENVSRPSPPRTGRTRRLAVLPFTNMSPDPQDEFFADGLTEEMISELSNRPGLQVIARTSVMRFKGGAKGVKEVGRELNVDVVLEGSVRKAGNRIRITCQLIDSASEAHLWVERFDRELTDIFAVQSEIALSVASHLGVTLGTHDPTVRPPTESLDGYFLYLRGRFLWHRRTPTSVHQALKNFEEVVAIDPKFAAAYSGIADCLLILNNNLEEIPWTEMGPRALAAARRAVELDEGLAEAHASLGLARTKEYDWVGAEQEYRRALELNPGYAPAHLWYHLLHLAWGRTEDAAAELSRAIETDPLSPVVWFDQAILAVLQGREEEAIRNWDHVLELEPGWAEYLPLYKVPFLVSRGRREEALALVQGLEAGWATAGDQLEVVEKEVPATLLAAVGREEEARRSLARLLQVADRSYVPAAGIAGVYAALGDTEKFFEWMDRAVADHSATLTDLRPSPLFDRVRGDPRFREIFRRCGVVESPSRPHGSSAS